MLPSTLLSVATQTLDAFLTIAQDRQKLRIGKSADLFRDRVDHIMSTARAFYWASTGYGVVKRGFSAPQSKHEGLAGCKALEDNEIGQQATYPTWPLKVRHWASPRIMIILVRFPPTRLKMTAVLPLIDVDSFSEYGSRNEHIQVKAAPTWIPIQAVQLCSQFQLPTDGFTKNQYWNIKMVDVSQKIWALVHINPYQNYSLCLCMTKIFSIENFRLQIKCLFF